MTEMLITVSSDNWHNCWQLLHCHLSVFIARQWGFFIHNLVLKYYLSHNNSISLYYHYDTMYNCVVEGNALDGGGCEHKTLPLGLLEVFRSGWRVNPSKIYDL